MHKCELCTWVGVRMEEWSSQEPLDLDLSLTGCVIFDYSLPSLVQVSFLCFVLQTPSLTRQAREAWSFVLPWGPSGQ